MSAQEQASLRLCMAVKAFGNGFVARAPAWRRLAEALVKRAPGSRR